MSTDTPATVFFNYFKTFFARRKLKTDYLAAQEKFVTDIKDLALTDDWFTMRIPYWIAVFEKYNLTSKNIRALEIGSFEGLSAYFTLHSLPQARLTCVDTWEGSDEHLDEDFAGFRDESVLSQIETNFDFNLKPYSDRLEKFVGTSYSYFNTLEKSAQFDLIYIDGSHHCDDVLIDCLKGFSHLKVGGTMIIDDYLWRYYDNELENPAAAVNAFLKLKKGTFKIIFVSYQLFLEKTGKSEQH